MGSECRKKETSDVYSQTQEGGTGLVGTRKQSWQGGVHGQNMNKRARGAHLLERAGVLLAMGWHWVGGADCCRGQRSGERNRVRTQKDKKLV